VTAYPENPWQKLPLLKPFVLPEDNGALSAFNASASDGSFVHLELLPEPFLGRPKAPVVVLGLNPGFKEADLAQHSDPLFVSRSRNNLLHGTADYPFYLLDPGIARTKWWDRKLGSLVTRVGRQVVARGVLCVEYFPYHSRRFHHRKVQVPSQNYSFGLVRQALHREAVIIVLRGQRLWFAAVPELQSYRSLYCTRSVQNPILSPRNCPEGYERAAEALKQVTSDGILKPTN
jgi:hypothetical protein